MTGSLRHFFLVLALGVCSARAVEQWGIFEIVQAGPADGNPFVEVEFSATFQQGDRSIKVPGFYDGGGRYKIRFMPPTTGEWKYRTLANRPELEGKSGRVAVNPPLPGNHGPVRVHDGTLFAYADGTPFRQLGTTCYAWTHQSPELEELTLKTLAVAPFNKLRMCVFPKWFHFNKVEPRLYPFPGTPLDQWDFTRFNPEFFQHLEKRIGHLGELGIQADIILFHPYDGGHWGFDRMGGENDDRYLRYVVARLTAYRNVWWSLANEWDLMEEKKPEDWERLGRLVNQSDPFGHLSSIHQIRKIYDPSRPWITHLSLQSDRPEDAAKHVSRVKKPVIYDECKYEGNIPNGWGKISAERMTELFWTTRIGGAFCGHGETYKHPDDILWWSKGGVLQGRSPARLAFFKRVMDDAPAAAKPLSQEGVWGVAGKYYLCYRREPAAGALGIDLSGGPFKAEILDTWEMTITPVPGEFSKHVEIPLPNKPYQAIRLTLQ